MRAISTATPISGSLSYQQLPVVKASMEKTGNNASMTRQWDSSSATVSKPSQQQQETHSPSSQQPPSPTSTIEFLTLCQRLKTTKRTGWVDRGLKETESIADHMYRMAVMAMVISDGVPGMQKDRCVKMAVVHDIAEAIVGDITPNDGVPKEEKSRREREAIESMCAMLGDGSTAAQEMKELWLEYENNATPEAKLVKDFDKLEMILQAQEYEEAQGKRLEDFFVTTRGKFQTDVGKALAAEVVRRRPPAEDLQEWHESDS